LEPGSQDQIDRFMGGFEIEDWFEWIFCSMPWVQLIHGLDQQQFPLRSKSKYQVPDFLVIVETSALTHQALLVEVKRVRREKDTLNLRKSQVGLCQQYASTVNLPLLYAVYWDKFSAWTLNTIDTFEIRSSTRKLAMTRAVELDCSAILGDVSHLVPPSLVRVSRYTKHEVTPSCVQHEKYGRLLSDVAVLGQKRVQMTTVESAAIDSMLVMKPRSQQNVGDGVIEITTTIDEIHILKLSSWITRHIGLLQEDPNEEYSNISAHVIADLMEKLGCQVVHLFPTNGTDELKRLDFLFRTCAPNKN
jgi:hypothetical protein